MLASCSQVESERWLVKDIMEWHMLAPCSHVESGCWLAKDKTLVSRYGIRLYHASRDRGSAAAKVTGTAQMEVAARTTLSAAATCKGMDTAANAGQCGLRAGRHACSNAAKDLIGIGPTGEGVTQPRQEERELLSRGWESKR